MSLKYRLYAFLIHLSISFIVALCASLMVFLVWYPAPLQDAVGVTKIFLILLSVDIVIGPVITFIIYSPGKPSLKFDLSVIALFQVAALLYGMHTVYSGRPAFVVYSVDLFEVTRALDIDAKSMEKAIAEHNPNVELGWSPRWVGALPSKNRERRQEIMFSSVQGGADWPQLPELYVPLSDVKTQILTKAKPLADLLILHHNNAQVDSLIKRFPNNEVKWVPLRGKVKNMTVLVDANSAEVREIVDIDPWN